MRWLRRALALPLFFPILYARTTPSSRASEPWEQYILSPSSRTTRPTSVYRIVNDGTVSGQGRDLTLYMSAGAHISLDFGVEVGGHVSFNIDTNTTDAYSVSLAFCESPEFVRPISDDTGAVTTENYDLAMNVTFNQTGEQWYITPTDWFRGGFRFLTINALAPKPIKIWNISCEIGFAPGTQDLRDYNGYFHTEDQEYELLNRMWYAGAYTVQTNIAPQNTGRFLPQVRPGWDYNATLGIGPGPFLLDGAKRDRAIWPGDLGVSGITAYLAFGAYGREAVNNDLDTLFYYQNASTGEFPYAGPDTASFKGGSQSDTYHSWSVIGMYDYAMYSGDHTWLETHWANISRGVEFIVAGLDPETGLQNQSQPNDWGRQGSGGFNSELNAISYHALVSMASLSNDSAQAQSWLAAAEKLKTSYNALLYDSAAGLYRDNTTTSLHPQDGNSVALLYNLTLSRSQAENISAALLQNWNAIGPVTPELPDTISPFVSGLELLGHFKAHQASTALELATRLWGHILDSPILTGSTFVEGMTANGSLYYRSTAGYNYDAAYTSLSHGWSTAPVQALLTEMVGLKITSMEGGFETGLGRFSASVSVVTGARDREQEMHVQVTAPAATQGEVLVPSGWRLAEVNGRVCSSGQSCSVFGGGTSTVIFHH
ncbi:glycoside hydrolase family 78 protein [Acidomyces richmondensis BFW]|nr:glycoside hydrolase family 78 protein [Acidomyces richmondensis BFW]